MTEFLICPTCSTPIDVGERCPVVWGMGRCMELVGHEGWHWTDMGGGGVTRWTGLYAVRKACAGRLSLSDWCQKPAGHDGAHNNGRGMSFSEPMIECPTCGGMDPADYINDPPHTLCPTCHGEMFILASETA